MPYHHHLLLLPIPSTQTCSECWMHDCSTTHTFPGIDKPTTIITALDFSAPTCDGIFVVCLDSDSPPGRLAGDVTCDKPGDAGFACVHA
jgi:hypothetical protein